MGKPVLYATCSNATLDDGRAGFYMTLRISENEPFNNEKIIRKERGEKLHIIESLRNGNVELVYFSGSLNKEDNLAFCSSGLKLRAI